VIYFVQAEDGGPIKIGTTGNLAKRFAELSQVLGRPVRVLGCLEGSFPEEHAIHVRFAHLRGPGECFDPAPELLAYIAEACREWIAEVREVEEILATQLPLARAARIRVHVGRVAAIVRRNTGQPFSAGKLSKMLNSVRVNPKDVGLLAAGLEVEPAELLRH
jgi:hypothetical protein